jgi:hypothetical protein
MVRRWFSQHKDSLKGCDVDDPDMPGDPTSALLYLPPGVPEFVGARTPAPGQKTYDAVATLKGLSFGRFLRNTAEQDAALEAAIEFACPDKELRDHVNEFKPRSRKRTSQYRARLKLDPCAMLIERREMQHMFETAPDSLESAHLFTDGSPVSGAELQGMVLQLCIVGGVIRSIIMPGVVLHYGGASVVDKAISFLWSLFLISGPSILVLNWILGRMTSVTTDMGTELGFIDVPNLLPAFLSRMAGTPLEQLRGLVSIDSRLVPWCLRIAGWSHTFGNLMMYAGKQVSIWPRILYLVRRLCFFFRNRTWRAQIVDQLGGRVDNIQKLLKTFRAGFKKWRYETLFGAFQELLALRSLCEDHLIHLDDIFKDFQDRDLLQDVRAACAWKDMWVFIAVFFEWVLFPLEKGRRWGMVCACCRDQRHNTAKQSKCPQASRRLYQAREFSIALTGKFAQDGRAITSRMCEGVLWVWRDVSFVLRKTSVEHGIKFNWVKKSPWLMSESYKPAQAAELARQLRELVDATGQH